VVALNVVLVTIFKHFRIPKVQSLISFVEMVASCEFHHHLTSRFLSSYRLCIFEERIFAIKAAFEMIMKLISASKF